MYPPTSSATVRYTHHGGAPATPSYTPHDHSLRSARPVLTRIGAGLALLAGLILMYLGMEGPEVVAHLRKKRPGALFNQVFADYLLNLRELPPGPRV